ncbi:MAG: hypothetical protein HZB30_01390 [Nitrospirae bacterium]|nr:hypothetical protein [Nitrospirota bacterium]
MKSRSDVLLLPRFPTSTLAHLCTSPLTAIVRANTMNFIRLLPVILSLLLLGAHFFRAANTVIFLLTVATPLLLLIRKPWVVRSCQIVLVAGGIEWIRTMVVLAKMRQASGEPWERLALILGGVALFTVCSVLVFRFRSLRERYKLT